MDAQLKAELNGLNLSIDRQMQVIIADVQGMVDDDGKQISPYQIKHTDGTYVLTPLIVAKAQVLNGLAVLSRK